LSCLGLPGCDVDLDLPTVDHDGGGRGQLRAVQGVENCVANVLDTCGTPVNTLRPTFELAEAVKFVLVPLPLSWEDGCTWDVSTAVV
jgi:hypothetical protein